MENYKMTPLKNLYSQKRYPIVIQISKNLFCSTIQKETVKYSKN